MNKKRETEYFKTLYQRIKIENKRIKIKEEKENFNNSNQKNDFSSAITRLDRSIDSNKIEEIPEDVIKSGLSTFGQAVDGSYSFLSCDISSQNLKNLNGIGKYPKLENLTCKENELEDVYDLHYLKNLFFLDLSKNHISKINSFRISSRLVTLDLSYNNLQKFPDISFFPFLKILRANNNKLVSIDSISHSHLEELYLSHNLISIIKGTLNLPQLEVLDFSFNELFDISPLNTLKNLQILRLNKNLINSLHAIKSLESLIELELACNSVASLDEIALLGHLQLLSGLDLSMNLCQSLKFYRFQVVFLLPSLTVLDGQPVDPKEQTKADCFFDQFIQAEEKIFQSELPEEKFIDKRVFMYNLVMKTHMSPRLNLSVRNVFGSSESLLPTPDRDQNYEDNINNYNDTNNTNN